MTERAVVNEYKAITREYAYNKDIFNEDDQKVNILKYIINHKLNQVDRTIILLYVDCQSYRKLGAKMGMSHMTIRREVVRIKNIIQQEYDKLIAD
jgi:DNA-directed RNA polymerase specialized sigma24 family protein